MDAMIKHTTIVSIRTTDADGIMYGGFSVAVLDIIRKGENVHPRKIDDGLGCRQDSEWDSTPHAGVWLLGL